MPDAVLVVNAASLPEGSCFNSEQERFNAFVAALQVTLPGNYGAINIGFATPSINNRHLPWDRNHADGSPDGTYNWFDGSWKRRHQLDPGFGGYTRLSAAAIPIMDGGVNEPITTTTGPFWEIDTEMAAKFPLGVGTLESGTVVALDATGGAEKVVLTMENLPAEPPPLGDKVEKMLVQRTEDGQEVGTDRKGLAQNASDFVFRTNSEDDHADNALGDLGSGVAHSNMPPYKAVLFIKRSARIFYSAQ